MKETEVRRTETNAPGVHSVREVQTTTNSNSQALPGIVGSGLRTRAYGRDHVITKQQITYWAPVVLALVLALTLLYLRSHEMFPWHHQPTMQEKLSNQYADMSGKAKDAAKMASESYAGKKAAEYAKDGSEWVAKQGLKDKAAEGWETVKEKAGDYAETIQDSLHLGKEKVREATDKSYSTRAKEWVDDKMKEATDTVGSATENIKHRVETLKEDARHASAQAKEEIRHKAASHA